MKPNLSIVILGLSLSSSWGNGHATTYRSLIRGLNLLGHRVLFLERDVPWYADNRDLPDPEFCRLELYGSPAGLRRWERDIEEADAVIVGSYVPEGIAVASYVLAAARGTTAFYDIDTPVTMAKLRRGDEEYLTPALISRFDLYLSFTGGPTLRQLEEDYGAHHAVPLYCSVDETRYRSTGSGIEWDLGYLGTYSEDRQPVLERLLLEPARRLPHLRFVVAGPQYPASIDWPPNVERIDHLSPERHAQFYGTQRFTLNVTRADMVAAGWSPSVRLFEAAACGVPIISDPWTGLDEFFPAGEAIVIARDTDAVVRALTAIGDRERRSIAAAARRIVLRDHTGRARARHLVSCIATAKAEHGIGRLKIA